MGSFNRDNNRSGGGRSFARRDFGGGRDMGRPQMHQAICSTCGKECELPFRPTGERPVYCRDCFAKNGGGAERNDRRDFRSPRDERPTFRKFNDERPQAPRNDQLDAINVKLDQILKLLTPQKQEVVAPIQKQDLGIVVKKKKAEKKVKVAPVETSVEQPQEVLE